MTISDAENLHTSSIRIPTLPYDAMKIHQFHVIARGDDTMLDDAIDTNGCEKLIDLRMVVKRKQARTTDWLSKA